MPAVAYVPPGVDSRTLCAPPGVPGIIPIPPIEVGPPSNEAVMLLNPVAYIGDGGGGSYVAILGLNALGFLSRTSAIVFFLIDSFSMLLQQPLQLQFLQYSPLEKHSQYNFKHREFLQLQFFFPP